MHVKCFTEELQNAYGLTKRPSVGRKRDDTVAKEELLHVAFCENPLGHMFFYVKENILEDISGGVMKVSGTIRTKLVNNTVHLQYVLFLFNRQVA